MIDARHIIGARPVLRYPIQPGQALDDAITWAVEMYRGQYGEPMKVWMSRKDTNEMFVCGEFQAEPKGGVTKGEVWVM